MRLALGLGLPPGGQAFDDAASRIISAFTTPPTAARAALINTTVVSLKAAGVWALFDALYMFAAADSQAALINWKNPGTFNATVVDTPTFTTDRGFTGNGSSDAISSGLVPSTAGGNFTQDSAHVSLRTLNDVAAGANASRAVGHATAPTGNHRVNLTIRNTGDVATGFINSSAGNFSIANTDTSDHFIVNRSGASAVQVYKAGASIGTSATASSGLPDQGIRFLQDFVAIFGTVQIASGSIGGSLNSTQSAALYAAELAYMQTVGAV